MTRKKSLPIALAALILATPHLHCASIPLSFGVTYSGTIAIPGETHTYSFVGTPGQRPFLDSQDADNLPISATLLSPGGTQLDQRNDDYDSSPYVLTEPGAYTLVLAGNGATVGNYRFRLLDLSQAAPLILGTTLSDQLNPSLACNIYQFNGSRGQRINLQSLGYSSMQAQWQLVSPANVVLGSGQIYQNLGTLTLPQSGPYCLMVSGYSVGLAPLAFQILASDVSDGPAVTSGFGVTQSGNVAANQTNSFTYTAPAGLPVYFDSLDKSGQSLVVDLVDSFGNAVFSISEVNDAGPYILPRAGSYTLKVRDTTGSGGPFNFRLLDLSVSPALPLNTALSNVLSAPYQTEIYQLAGTAGQRLYFDALASTPGNVQVQLIAPNGQSPISTSSLYDQGPVTLPFSGVYYLLTMNAVSTPSPYNFQMLDIGSQPVMPLNVDVTGTLPANYSLVYQLPATNGQQLYFNGKGSSFGGAYWTLYDPKNSYVLNGPLWTDFGLTIPYSGNYVLLFTAGAFDATYSNQVGSVSWTTNTLTLGTPVTNNIVHPGDQIVYTFSGTAGQRLFYDALTPVYFSMNVALVSPTGVAVWSGNANSDFGPIDLSVSGTYSLVFNGGGDTTGGINFQLLDVGVQPALPLNTDITGTLPANTALIYQLAGTNGERLYFNGKGSGVPNAYWTLYDPKNAQLAYAGFSGDFGFPLPYTGNYTLVFQTGASPGAYSNQVNTFSFVTNALTLGNPTTATIANPGDISSYTFSGNAGQRLFFDSLNAVYIPSTVTLLSPSGQTVFSGNGTADLGQPYTLTESGTYLLELAGTGDATGTIAFQLLDVSSQPALPLNTDIKGTLAANTCAIYQFTGSQGQQLYFNAKAVSNGGAYWTLCDPGNTPLFDQSLSSDFQLILPASGSYVLILSGIANAVGYTNQVNTFAYTTNALTLGPTTTGTIVNPGDQLYYTFTGTAGQRLYYDSRQTNYSGCVATLISPTGVTLFSVNSATDKGPITLHQDGAYALILSGSGDATSMVTFQLLDLGSATPTIPGSTITDSLSDQTQTRLYRFSGVQGQRLDLKSLSASANQAYWALLGLQDQYLAQAPNLAANIGTVTLPATGSYVLAVIGTGSASFPVTYQLSLADVSDASATTNGFGIVYSGTLNAGQTNTVAITGPAGLPVLFDSQDTSGQNLVVDLIGPDGVAAFSATETSDAGPYVLPRSGTYTLSVRGYNSTFSGNYSFRLLDLSVSPHLVLNTAVNATQNNPYQTDVYQFTSSAGQRLIYDALTNDVNYPSVNVQLLDPSGQSIGPSGDFANDKGPFSVGYAGTCYLIFRNNKAVPDNFAFQLLDVSAQPTLPVNTGVTNTLNVYPTLAYRYNGTAGQRLYFGGQPNNPSGYWTLYDPNSVVGASAGLSGDFEVTLPTTGVYTLVLNSSSSSPGTEAFQVNDFSFFTNNYTVGTSVVDAINRPGERRIYTFTGTVGQQLIYDALTNDPPSPSVILVQMLNPQGVQEGPIGGRFTTDRGPFTLKESGTYSLIFDGNGSGVGSIAFRLLDVSKLPAVPINDFVTNLLDLYPDIAYQLAGTNGERLYFGGQSSNPSGNWTLYDPENRMVNGAGVSGDFEVSLPMTGAYALVLNNYTSAGTNIFRVNDFSYFTNAYTLGSTVVDAIKRPGERRFYTFIGTIGQQLVYDALTNDPPTGDVIVADLLNPQGISEGEIGGRFSFDRGPFRLQQSGLYTLVMDGQVAGVGPIAFQLLDVSAQPGLPLNTPVTNNFIAYQRIVYRYAGTAGQQLYFRSLQNNLIGNWTLYDPDTVSISGSGLGGDFQVVLPKNGLYSLVLDSGSSTPGAITFEVYPFNYGETLQVNRAPVLSHIPDQITGEGSLLSFTAQATDLDNNLLTFSLDPGGPGGASINPTTGVFSWTPPGTGFSLVTNVTVRVTDNGVPALSAAQTLSISVIAAPIMITVKKNGASATVFWRSAIGKHYQLQYKNNLSDVNWTTIGGIITSVDFTTSEVDNSLGGEQERFYRVILLDP
jgi:hypothetical protein